MSKQVFKTTLCGRPLEVEVGQLAQFANGSALVRFGDTVILSTATSASPREGIDFFPLSVDYEERMYSIGKIPGGFLRREGRPSEKAILTSRLIDRPLRPLFPKDLRNDVSINNLVLCADFDNSPEMTAMLGSSIALAISDIPWNGPVAGMQVGLVDGEIILDPTLEQQENSDLDLKVAGTKDKVCMIEAGANEVPDELMLEAIIKAHQEIIRLCEFVEEIRDAVGKPKYEYKSFAVDAEILQAVRDFAYDKMRHAVLHEQKEERDAEVSSLTEAVKEHIEALNEEWVPEVGAAVHQLEKEVVREYLFKEHKRVDGRALDQIRPLSAEIDILPRTHGTGLFQRGQTQVLTICTLGPLSDAQKLDGVDPAESKRYIHHYNFPGYSVGEAKPNRSPGRREIGHGALAERSLVPVLPSEEEFPYAIRCVSEITMSNGSTSQGSVCASTLALMAAGVPIKKPVAGISSGLIVNPENKEDYLVFMDIQGIEDFFGDMDFKVAGTEQGITSIQVDIKVDGLSYDIIRDAFAMTKKGRLQILNEVIKPVIGEPRSELSAYAPRIEQIDIPADKIREVIGSGGKVIKMITETTKTQIDIVEDGALGHVYIASPDMEACAKALKLINSIVNDPEIGDVFTGKVTRLMSFGAFVEFAPGKEGMVHISRIAWKHVADVSDELAVGDEVTVKVINIDDQGRIDLSIRDTQEKPADYQEQEKQPRRKGPNGPGGMGLRRSKDKGFDKGPRPPRREFKERSDKERDSEKRADAQMHEF